MSEPITALLITRNRATDLARALDSLATAALHCPRAKLRAVVFVNGPDAETIALLQRRQWSLPLQVIESRLHLLPGEARNEALRGISGGWVFFIDDDAYIEPDFLERFFEAARSNPGASAFGGPNLTPPGSSLFQRLTGIALSSRFATYVSNARYRAFGPSRNCSEESLILCNLFVRREALGDVPFAPGMICAEENWFLQTLAASGKSAIYAPNLFVWHERRPTLKTLVAQVYKYGFGRGQNLRRRPAVFRFAHAVPSIAVAYAVASLPAFSVELPILQLALAVPFLAYGICCISAGLIATRRNQDSLVAGIAVSALFPVIHVSYGIGLLRGLFR